jgi:nitrogen fixation/metabolism regulation signal transduction histidine kinase
MRSTFRSRVFRLLLLFAAVPSVILTIIAYYLVSDPDPISNPDQTDEVGDLSDYFQELLYHDIDRALEAINLDQPDTSSALDFLLPLRTDDSSRGIKNASIGAEIHAAMRDAANARPRGVVAIGDNYYQYSTRTGSSGAVWIGGIVHDSTFAVMSEAIQRATAEQSARTELRATYLAFIALLFLTVTALTIVAAYVLSRRVSRNLAGPVVALSEASQHIAAGDFKQQVKLSADGEIGRLIESFNGMAGQLDRMTSRLAQTERVAAWRQVARRFAHELKNPLQPILVSLYRLEKQLADTELWDVVKDPLRASREEVQHLTLLADRFSSLAQLPPPNLEEVDLRQLAKSTAELYREELEAYAFHLEMPETDVAVVTDPAYLREATHNLLQNAIDACQPGDSITIRLTSSTDAVTLAVSDTGSGMDEPTLSSARLPYFTTKAKGNGLGLAIVERSMAELGGQLKVDSKVGAGTTVSIVLPGDGP